MQRLFAVNHIPICRSIVVYGFTFRRHLRLNWPEYRLMAIERHLQKRVRQLLELAPELRRRQEIKQRDLER